MTTKQPSIKEKYENLMKELREQKSETVLDKVYQDLRSNKASILDNNTIPIQFSEELIWFLLNFIIKADTQMDIFKLYLDAVFELNYKPEVLVKAKLLYEIFDVHHPFYRNASKIDNFLVFLKIFFNLYYPKDTTKVHEVGDIMDILITEDFNKLSLYGWIQMPIKRIDKENNLYIFEDYKNKEKEIMIAFDSFKVQEKNRFVKEEEMKWRNELKLGDKVDYLTATKNWVEGEVKQVQGNDQIYIKAYGDFSEEVNFLHRYSPFIQPLLKYSLKVDEDEKNYLNVLEDNTYFSKFGYCIPYTDKNYLIPFESMLGIEYYEITNYFVEKVVQTSILSNKSMSIEHIYYILDIMYSKYHILNVTFFGKYIYEKGYENIKEILLRDSLDKKKSLSKVLVDNIITFLDSLIGVNFYFFQITKFLPAFIIEFGYNCFSTSESLEKRLLGLNCILRTLELFKKMFGLISTENLSSLTAFVTEKLINNSENKDLISLIFNDPNIHEQLLLKGKQIVLQLAKIRLLDDKDIERLYNLALSAPLKSDISNTLYDVLVGIIEDLSLSQSKIIFDKIITFPFDKIKNEELDLMQRIIKNIKPKDDFRNMTKQFLDYFYDYIVIYKQKDITLAYDFGLILSYAEDNENLSLLNEYYFDKIVNELDKQNDLEGYRFFFILLNKILDALKTLESKKVKKDISFLKQKFKEIFFKNISYEKIVDKILLLNNTNISKYNDEYIINIIEITSKFLEFSDLKNFYSIEGIMKLCDYFIFSDEKKEKRNDLLLHIHNIEKDDLDKDKFYDCFFKKLDGFLDTINFDRPERFKLIDDKFIIAIFNFYKQVNNLQSNFKFPKTEEEYFEDIKQMEKKLNPLDLKYFDIIWKLSLKSNNEDKLNDFLAYFSLRKFTPSERHEIWEKCAEKVFKEIDQNVFISLTMLKILIKVSEEYGNAGAVSHLAETKKKFPIVINLKNKISSYLQEKDKEDIIAYSTSSFYDVKKLIQKKYGIDPYFIDFNQANLKENIKESNSKYLFSVFPKLNDINTKEICLVMKRNKKIHQIPLYPLNHEDKTLTEKTKNLVKKIFKMYAKDEKMTINEFNSYSKDVIFGEEATQSDIIKTEFREYLAKKKDNISLDEFIEFNQKCAERPYYFCTMLENLGYNRGLDFYLEPIPKDSYLYYEENNEVKYMPRYFIGNNKTYMAKLFGYANSDNKEVHELAQNLIKEVCSLEEMKTTLFGNSDKIDQIITNKNLELKAYAYEILLVELEKCDEDKEKGNNNLINTFINNHLNKLIIELNKILSEKNKDKEEIKEEKKEENKEEKKADNKQQPSQFINYYLSNLKILIYSFKTIVNNSDFNEMIERFEEVVESEGVIPNIGQLILDEEKINIIKKMNLYDLVNVLTNNFSLFEKNTTPNQRTGIKLTLRLLLYIISFSKYLSEEEKKKIYNNYNSFEIQFSQSGIFLMKTQIHSMSKFITHLMNSEGNQEYIDQKFSKYFEEILNYTKLNCYVDKLVIFVKMFNELQELSIKDTKNDQNYELFTKIINLLFDEKIELLPHLITGYLGIIKKIIITLRDSKYQKILEYDFESLINKLIKNFLIIYEKDENNKIINVLNFKKYSKISELNYIQNIYNLIIEIISFNPEKYIKLFFENDDIKNVIEKHLSKFSEPKTDYSPKKESISTTAPYVGLKNLSSLCYINSVIQQFYMIPLFKNAILSLPIDPKYKEEDDNDDLLFQLEKMFYYLNYSQKEHYNPKWFVFSFKDYEGNPTNIHVQCDAQEFLSRFIEKIEEQLRNNSQKYLCNNVFEGTVRQQVKCTNPDCGNISEKKDVISYLSLDIKDCDDLKKCLAKFIVEEKIEDYNCEKCKKKITNIKSVLLDTIPNILIIHLQRIAFSYETFNMEKINKFVSFEKTINIKDYTVNKDNKDIPLDYFEYELQGVLIHSGTAQFGHYYSYIYSEDNKNKGQWYKFNDQVVTQIDYDKIQTEAYGSNCQHEYGSSAYMLIYTKKIKKPVIVNCRELRPIFKNVFKDFHEGDVNKLLVKDEPFYYVYETATEAIEQNIKENVPNNKLIKKIVIKKDQIEADLVTYEEAVENLIKKNNDENEPKPFKNNILIENIKLNNDKKFFGSGFIKYMKSVTQIIKNEIYEDKENQKINNYLPILKTIHNFIINILCVSSYIDELKDIIQNVTNIYNHCPSKELLSYIIKDTIEPNKEKLYENFLTCKVSKLGNSFAEYLGKIICCGINNNIESEISNNLVKFYLDKIPIEITKKWLDMEGFNSLIMHIIENSDIIKKNFIQEKIIAKLIDYILGKSSPFYQGDQRIDNQYNKGKFGPIVKSIALLYKYYIENYEKEKIEFSPSCLKLINHIPFYEKVVMEDYDSEACNLLIDYKMKLSFMLSKTEEQKEEFNAQIINIMIKLKFPCSKTIPEINSGFQIIINLLKKYSDYKDDKQKNIFIEKLNQLLGIPIPYVHDKQAMFIYISGNYHEYTTLLTKLHILKKDKDLIPLLKSIFELSNINNLVFEYLDKLPAPNSLKFSYMDYVIKTFLVIEEENMAVIKTLDEMNMPNPIKDLSKLVHEICEKNKKDIKKIQEQININEFLYFDDFSFEKININKNEDKISIYEVNIDYYLYPNQTETVLPCFDKINYFYNLTSKNKEKDITQKDGCEKHSLTAVVICYLVDAKISVDFEPYFISKLQINGKKECHFYISCMDYQKDKKIDYSKLNIEVTENQPLALPGNGGEEAYQADNSFVVNCNACGRPNTLNGEMVEYKCMFCESPLL